MYNTTLVEIHPTLVVRILAGYDTDAWWSRLQHQVQANEDLGPDKASLPFVSGTTSGSDADSYLAPRPEEDEPPQPNNPEVPQLPVIPEEDLPLPPPDKSRLLYHINRMTGVQRLCIPSAVAPDILAIAHGNGHPGFSCCYEIITRSWFMRGLTKMLREFISHCSECLALQTRRHPPSNPLSHRLFPSTL